jgi:nucleoside-diphosphate-sugar epimerase
VVYQALEAGYRVRLSIRKPEQEALLKQRYPTYTSQIETIVIPDISKREAFDEAVLHDVEYIIHLASPVPGRGQDLKEDYIKPAVQGTEAILHAALRLPKIKTVVVTSSVLGLIPMDSPLTGSDSPIRGKLPLYNVFLTVGNYES